MQADNVVRPVSSTAMWNVARHSLGLYRCVMNTCQYVAPNDGHWDESPESRLEVALAHVTLKHDILRVGIVGEDTEKPAFVHVKTIDMRRMIEHVDITLASDSTATSSDPLLRSLEKHHDRLWEDLPSKPGWKIIVHRYLGEKLKQIIWDISFSFHHAYSDGRCAYTFHRDLLRTLNQRDLPVPAELHGHVLHLPSAPHLPPPMESLVPFSVSCLFVIKTVLEELVPEWVKLTLQPLKRKTKQQQALLKKPWTGSPIFQDPHRARLRAIHVHPESLTKILDACRAQDVTLTPFLHALILTSLASRLDASEAPSFHASTPVSLAPYVRRETDTTPKPVLLPDLPILRRRCHRGKAAEPSSLSTRQSPPFDPNNGIHCLVTFHPHIFPEELVALFRQRRRHCQSSASSSSSPSSEEEEEDPSESSSPLWKAASSVSLALRQKRETLPKEDVNALTGFVTDWQKFFLDKIKAGERKDSWEVSNLGSMKIEDGEGKWKIKRSIFSQGATPVGAAFGFNVAGVEGEGVWITVNWQEGAVEEELMEGLVEDVRGWCDGFGEVGDGVDGGVFGIFG